MANTSRILDELQLAKDERKDIRIGVTGVAQDVKVVDKRTTALNLSGDCW